MYFVSYTIALYLYTHLYEWESHCICFLKEKKKKKGSAVVVDCKWWCTNAYICTDVEWLYLWYAQVTKSPKQILNGMSSASGLGPLLWIKIGSMCGKLYCIGYKHVVNVQQRIFDMFALYESGRWISTPLVFFYFCCMPFYQLWCLYLFIRLYLRMKKTCINMRNSLFLFCCPECHIHTWTQKNQPFIFVSFLNFCFLIFFSFFLFCFVISHPFLNMYIGEKDSSGAILTGFSYLLRFLAFYSDFKGSTSSCEKQCKILDERQCFVHYSQFQYQ